MKTRKFDDLLLRLYNAIYRQNRIEKWIKDCILPFPKKGNLRITKSYRSITQTTIAAKVYNTVLLNCIKPEIKKILRKDQNGSRRNRSTTSHLLAIRPIIERVHAKYLKATLLFVDFSKTFDSIHREKIEQILPAYVLKETVRAIMLLYKNTKAIVRSPDEDADFFDIVAGVFQRHTLTPHLFIICIDSILRTSIDLIKENGFTMEKVKKQTIPQKL